MVDGPRGSLRHADAGKIGERAGRVINKYKVAKHFELQIADGSLLLPSARPSRSSRRPRSTGSTCCAPPAPTTSSPPRPSCASTNSSRWPSAPTARSRTRSTSARSATTSKTASQAHFFLFLLAYYLLFELQARLAPMLFTDDTPLAPADPVAPARRSPAANTKAGRRRTPDGLPAYNLPDLIAELGTICRNQLRIGDSEHTFPRLTNPNPVQTKALALLDTKLAK